MKNIFNTDIMITAEKKGRKGEGAAAILNLMGSVLDFLDKVDLCVEAQMVTENKEKIMAMGDQIQEMYGSLAEMAKGATQSIRSTEVEVVDQNKEEQPVANKDQQASQSSPVLLNVPKIPNF